MEGTQEREEYKSKVKKLIEKYNIKKIKKKEIQIKESVGSGGQATVRLGIYENEEVVIKKLSGRLDWKCLADELEIGFVQFGHGLCGRHQAKGLFKYRF